VGCFAITGAIAINAGTVGTPIPGVDLTLAEDGEVLVKAPFVTAGYYRDLPATQAAIDAKGWFHTGDLGRLSDDGFLTLTGVKKDRFKLSTGKYVSPLPLEQAVEHPPWCVMPLRWGQVRSSAPW
jgi:long-chain acyl-CoA synthetase